MIGQEFMSSNTLTGTIREYTKDSAFLPLLLNVSTSTFKPLVLNEVKTFQQGVDLIFNHETLSTEVVRVIAYICIILIILWSLTCCFPKLKLWLKSFCLITKPEKYWGMRKYIIPSPFIRQNKTNENPPGDPLETYMSTFRQRLAKIINRPSESPSIEQPYKNDASDIEANNMTFGTLPGYRTQKP
jgi:RsiW-degrading membrane proteinase PrsW (M82 family)